MVGGTAGADLAVLLLGGQALMQLVEPILQHSPSAALALCYSS